MRENRVKTMWREGQIAFGAWLSIADAYAAETMAQVGFDWLCVDMQHGVIVYVGPADLSITLGLEPRMDNGGAFDDARRSIATACAKHGVIAGIHANAKLAQSHADAGYQMITVAGDVGGMARAATEDLRTVR